MGVSSSFTFWRTTLFSLGWMPSWWLVVSRPMTQLSISVWFPWVTSYWIWSGQLHWDADVSAGWGQLMYFLSESGQWEAENCRVGIVFHVLSFWIFTIYKSSLYSVGNVCYLWHKYIKSYHRRLFTYLCRESVRYESEGWAIFIYQHSMSENYCCRMEAKERRWKSGLRLEEAAHL